MLPDLSGRRRIVLAAALVDSVGSGIFAPLSLLYFTRYTHLGLGSAGLVVGLGQALSIPAGMIAGIWVHHIGEKGVIALGLILQCLGYLGYPAAHSAVEVLVLRTVIGTGDGFFWTGYPALLPRIAKEGELPKWYGLERSLRNGGAAVGSLITAILLAATTEVYVIIPLADALSFLACALIVMVGTMGVPETRNAQRETREKSAGTRGADGYRAVLRDARVWLFAGSVGPLAMCSSAVTYALPVFAVSTLGLPPSFSAIIIAVNTSMVVLLQPVVGARISQERLPGALVQCALVWAVTFAALLPLQVSHDHVFLGIAVVALAALFTAGELLYAPAAFSYMGHIAPDRLRGRYMGVHQTVFAASGSGSPVIQAGLLEFGPWACWLGLLGLSVVGGVQAHRLKKVTDNYPRNHL
jgi:hypothetical protein